MAGHACSAHGSDFRILFTPCSFISNCIVSTLPLPFEFGEGVLQLSLCKSRDMSQKRGKCNAIE